MTNVPTHDRPSKPRFIVRVLGALLLLVFLVALSEVFFSAFFFLSDGRWIWPQQRWEPQENQFLAAKTNGPAPRKTLYRHPYLLDVYNRNPPCSLYFVNSQGFSGRAFPFRRSNEVFAVLLTGGSVAAQLGQTKKQWAAFSGGSAECLLTAAQGCALSVYNGAVGGWKQPQQTIVSLLYGDAYDAVVMLDGFNELQFLTVTRLEMANHDFELLNPLATQSSRAIIAAAITNQTQAWVTSSPARHSFTAYFFADRLRSWVVRTSTAGLANRKMGLPLSLRSQTIGRPRSALLST